MTSAITFGTFSALSLLYTVVALLLAAVTQDSAYLHIAGVSATVGAVLFVIYLLIIRALRNDPFIKAYRSTSELRK